jgi:hypothetical protein
MRPFVRINSHCFHFIIANLHLNPFTINSYAIVERDNPLSDAPSDTTFPQTKPHNSDKPRPIGRRLKYAHKQRQTGNIIHHDQSHEGTL